MRKTFQELAEELDHKFREENGYYLSKLEPIIFAVELMELVRKQTLIEASNKAEVHYTIVGKGDIKTITIKGYVLKESILELNKNNIEI